MKEDFALSLLKKSKRNAAIVGISKNIPIALKALTIKLRKKDVLVTPCFLVIK